MAWLFLGLIALPFAAAAYAGFQWLWPRLLEPVPERIAPEEAPPRRRRVGWRLSSRQNTVARGAAAAAVLTVIALAVNRWPSVVKPGAASVAPAAEVQLPPPIPLKVQTRFGSDGAGQGQPHDPRDIAVDPAGNVYVADTGNKRIVKFKPDGSFAAEWSTSRKGALAEPSALALAKDGLIVDDSESAQLHKYDFNGEPQPTFEHDLGLSHPRGLAVGPDGIIYVGDTANDRIMKVGPDGTPLGAFDTKGAKLEQPTGIAVDQQGSVYSIEPAASRIQQFAADGTLQAHLFLPPAVTVFPPRGLILLGGQLAVSLPDQNELLTYKPSGEPQTTFVPQPDPAAPNPLRPLGLASTPDQALVWVVWNTSSTVTELAWPLPG
ncbi:MAG TPA: NHL repeat-containing protein [Chloroflexota bacterium]|nr:NHL repeat-containing protein [Chloroflexota bacterium]